jgi:hypothetical protein
LAGDGAGMSFSYFSEKLVTINQIQLRVDPEDNTSKLCLHLHENLNFYIQVGTFVVSAFGV